MTIAFGQVFWVVAIKAHTITGGEDGLLKIARLPASLGVAAFDLKNNVALYYFVLVIFVGVSLLLWRLVHSPFGRIVKAIKQNETRARFVGYDVWRYKAAVLVISAGLSGLAGALFAMAQSSAFPRRHEPALLGLRGDDDAGRRWPGVVLGSGDRRPAHSSSPAM